MSNSSLNQMPLHFTAFISNLTLKELLDAIIIEHHCDASITMGGIEPAVLFLQKAHDVKLVLLDMTESADLLADVQKVLKLLPPETHLFVIGNENNLAFYRNLRRIGVSEYLPMPISKEELWQAMYEVTSHPVNREVASLQDKSSIVVLGARGGVGATTVAVNLASLAAIHFDKKVCLVDADLYYGNVNVMLDVAPSSGLNDALKEMDRMDDTFVKRLMISKDKFSILQGQLALDQPVNFNASDVHALLALVRQQYDILVLDCPSYSNHLSQAILNFATTAIIVTDLSLASVQSTLRLKSLLQNNFPMLSYHVVANHVFPYGGVISKAVFEKGTYLSVAAELPFCKASILEGINSGEPFTKTYPNHRFSKELSHLLQVINPRFKIIDHKTSMLDRLWKR